MNKIIERYREILKKQPKENEISELLYNYFPSIDPRVVENIVYLICEKNDNPTT